MKTGNIWRKGLTIQRKLTLLFLFVGLAPILVTSYTIYQTSSNELIEREQSNLVNIVDSLSNGMDQWLDKRVSHIELMAQTEEIQSLDAVRQLRQMNIVKDEDDTYETVVFTGIDGIVSAHTTEEHIGVLDLSDRDYIQNGLEGQGTISNVLVSNSTMNRIVVIASPVYNEDGEIIGVLSASVNFEALVGQFLEIDSDTDGSYFILVDGTNIIQLHRDEEFIGEHITDVGLGEKWVHGLNEGTENTGTLFLEDNDSEVLMAYSPMDNAGYSVSSVIPMSTVLAADNDIQRTVIILVTISTIFIILLATQISKKISHPIKHITEEIKKVAEGNVSSKPVVIKSKDEIGDLGNHLNLMKIKLKDLLHQVQDGAETVTASSEELLASFEQSASATEEIAASIQEVSYGIETQTATTNTSVSSIKSVSDGINQIAKLSGEISDRALIMNNKSLEGDNAVSKTSEKIQLILGAVEASNETNQSLNGRSKEVNNIVETITNIADKTNLLALNASIEAARAGEGGKGFAVVAEEVKKLAEGTKQSSLKIGTIINDIQFEIKESFQSMQTVRSEVNEGLQTVKDTQSIFLEMRETVEEVTYQISKMKSASQQTASEATDVSDAFSNIADISKKNAAQSENVAAAAEEQLASTEVIEASAKSLSELAEELQIAVNQFIIK